MASLPPSEWPVMPTRDASTRPASAPEVCVVAQSSAPRRSSAFSTWLTEKKLVW
jgi:hypothetical protein